MSRYRDITGQQFGNWMALRREKRSKGMTYWCCRCRLCHDTKMIALSNITGEEARCWTCKPPRSHEAVLDSRRIYALAQCMRTYSPVAIAWQGEWIPVTKIPEACHTVGDYLDWLKHSA